MLRQTFLTLSNSRELQDIALSNGMARRFALRFVAGETLDQAVRAIRTLNARGIMATFDHLGENVSTHDEARAAADSYIEVLNRIEFDPYQVQRVAKAYPDGPGYRRGPLL